MSKTRALAGLLVLTLAAPATLGRMGTASAQPPKHNCSFCHNLHGGSFSQLRDFAVVEDLCLSCHSPAGPPEVDRDGVLVPVPQGPFDVHDGPKHATFGRAPTGCWDCHNHEGEATGPSATNLKLIQASMPTPVSGTLPTVFTSRGSDVGQPTLNSFADGDQDGDGSYTGVCEVCHTETNNHQNGLNLPDDSNHAHQVGRTCVVCHTHGSGFAPGGPCANCHDTGGEGTTGPNNRRPIIPEMSRSSHHVGAAYEDSDCQVCHNMAQHTGGQVRLKDADDPATIYTLVGDPATSPSDAATLTDFCASCHDANGANGVTAPFSDGLTAPNVTTNWSAASHNSTTPQVGCFGDGTFGCHASGHGSEKRKLLAPPSVGPGAANAGEEEGFCYVCHDGSPAGTNIQGEFQKGTNTASRTFHHPVNDSEQPTTGAGRNVECTGCHNPHQAQSANKHLGVIGIDLNGLPVSDPAEYELCLLCHGDGFLPNRDINGDGFNDTSNKRLDFARNASAYHPVQQAGRNRSGALQEQLIGGLDTLSTILCSDCHNNDQTNNAQGPASNSAASPQGPHGSTIFPILRDISDLRAIQPEGAATASQFSLCFLCHSESRLMGDNNNVGRDFGSGARTNFYGASTDNLHWFHLIAMGGATCRTCHYNTHGNQSAGNTTYRIIDGGTNDFGSPPIGYKTRNVNFSPSVQPRGGQARPIFRINISNRARACLLVCHGLDHDGTGDFTYIPQAAHGQPGQDNDPLTYTP